MAVTVTFVIKDDQGTPQPIEDCLLWIFDSSDVYITEGQTDAVGELDVMLDGAADPGTEYIVRMRKNGYSFPAGMTQLFYVLEPVTPPDTNIFDFTAHERTVSESFDPNFCKLSGYFIDASGRALANKTLVFHRRWSFPNAMLGGLPPSGNPSVVDRSIIAAGRSVITDEAGYVELLLPRGGFYDVHVYGLEDPANIISPIVVPDAAGWKLEDVLFPYVSGITYGTNPVSINTESTAEVDIIANTSDGRSLLNCDDLNTIINFTSSDETVATAELVDGKLIVSGHAVGSATVTAARIDGSVSPRLPAVADLISTPLTVGVS